MRGTWTRWRAEQRSVNGVSARHEQAKRGAIAFLDALRENRRYEHHALSATMYTRAGCSLDTLPPPRLSRRVLSSYARTICHFNVIPDTLNLV